MYGITPRLIYMVIIIYNFSVTLKITILPLLILLLVPVLIYAQTVNEDNITPNDSFDGLIPDDDTVGPVGIVDELHKAHSDVTGIMIDTTQSIGSVGYVNEEVYLEAVYVDEENQTLVIWLDPAQMYDPLDIEDIQEELGVYVPIEINYGFFQSESSPSEATACPADSGSSTCYFWDRYIVKCLPERTTSRCTTYTTIINGAGYALPTLLSSSTPVPLDSDNDGINDSADQCINSPETVNGYQDTDGCPDVIPVVIPVVNSGGTIFQDDFANGLGKWINTGQQEWQSGTLDESAVIPGYTSSNKIAEADDCDDEACILSMTTPIDLSDYSSATLSFDRFVDGSHDYGEYLAVEVGNNGDYTRVLYWTHGNGDDHMWHHETVDLTSYLDSGFNLRFVTEQSSSSEDVGIDNVTIIGEASTECVLDVTATLQNGSIVINWNDCGDNIMRYKAYYTENGSSSLRYIGWTTNTSITYNSPVEGSNYIIKAKAQYADTGQYTELFESNPISVPVVDVSSPTITVPSNITVDATDSNGSIIHFTVSAYDSIDGSIYPTCDYASGDTFAVGSTTVTCNAIDNAGNTGSNSFTVTINPKITTPQPEVESECLDSDSSIEIEGQCYTLDLSNNDSLAIKGATPFIHKHTISSSGLEMNNFGATITIGATKDGNDGFITAGHTLVKGSTDISLQSILVSIENNLRQISDITEVLGPNVYLNQKADAIFIQTYDNVNVSKNSVQLKNSTDVISITSKGGINETTGFLPVLLVGQSSDHDGKIVIRNATVADDIGFLNYEQSLAIYESEKGDSGSPILSPPINNESILYGLHVGKLCQYTTNPDMPLFPNLSIPGTSCLTHLKVITNWENIVTQLEIEP